MSRKRKIVLIALGISASVLIPAILLAVMMLGGKNASADPGTKEKLAQIVAQDDCFNTESYQHIIKKDTLTQSDVAQLAEEWMELVQAGKCK